MARMGVVCLQGATVRQSHRYKAGYNPQELANFFEILNKQGGSPPQFLSDHPSPGNRSAAIDKEIRNWPPKKYQSTSSDFQSANSIALKTKS
ncbi:MAG: hypothetical protein ACM3N3_10230, partial [Betaproteobacteria bacterium]